jgi:hypothetical protein
MKPKCSAQSRSKTKIKQYETKERQVINETKYANYHLRFRRLDSGVRGSGPGNNQKRTGRGRIL